MLCTGVSVISCRNFQKVYEDPEIHLPIFSNQYLLIKDFPPGKSGLRKFTSRSKALLLFGVVIYFFLYFFREYLFTLTYNFINICKKNSFRIESLRCVVPDSSFGSSCYLNQKNKNNSALM